MNFIESFILLSVLLFSLLTSAEIYRIGSEIGRQLDGVGGISGGGVRFILFPFSSFVLDGEIMQEAFLIFLD